MDKLTGTTTRTEAIRNAVWMYANLPDDMVDDVADDIMRCDPYTALLAEAAEVNRKWNAEELSGEDAMYAIDALLLKIGSAG